MSDETTSIDIETLRKFVPLSSLAEERLKELAVLATVENMGPEVHLFHEGDVDNQTMYLLQGAVQLISTSDGEEELILSETPESIHPIADSQPRQVSAVASSAVSVLCIDNNVLDYMLTWDQITTMEKGVDNEIVESNEEESLWMNRMHSLRPFRNIPTANIKQLMDKMEEKTACKDDVIIRQGEAGDYFYLLDKGAADVTRQVQLADLNEGEGFGEEALISDSVRNATVTMTTDGVVMRLSKKDFNALLKEPLLNWVAIDEAREKVNKGAIWLDVRFAKEFNHRCLYNAVNIPLHELRQRMTELDKSKSYICYCKTGKRSSAAAFLLSQSGYKVSVLRGGLQVLPRVMRK